MNIHSVSTQFESGLAFTATIDQYKIKMDTTDDNSQHLGPSPKKLMLAALAGCTGIDVVSILNKMQVTFSHFSIRTDASLTEEHPKIYDKVAIVYAINVFADDRHKVERAVQLSKEKYCGVSAMFGHFATIDWEIEFL